MREIFLPAWESENKNKCARALNVSVNSKRYHPPSEQIFKIWQIPATRANFFVKRLVPEAAWAFRGFTLTSPISPCKHFIDFWLLLWLTNFCSFPTIGPMKKILLASWAIDLLSSKHFCCKKLHLKIHGYSLGPIFTFWEKDAIHQLSFH